MSESAIRWARVNDEPYEYAIQQGLNGDEFVKLLDGSNLRRVLDDQPTWEDQAREKEAETRKLLALIKEGVQCPFDDAMVTLFIEDDSDPSVGLNGRPYLTMSCNYEIIPSTLLRDIKTAFGEDRWEDVLDLWQQTYGRQQAAAPQDTSAGKIVDELRSIVEAGDDLANADARKLFRRYDRAARATAQSCAQIEEAKEQVIRAARSTSDNVARRHLEDIARKLSSKEGK